MSGPILVAPSRVEGAVGVEFHDVVRALRSSARLSVHAEVPHVGAMPPRVTERRLPVLGEARVALFYGASLGTRAVLRVDDGDRCHVPRRLAFTVADPANAALRAWRLRRVQLFPGAGYPYPSGMTGVRGVARRGGAAVRWARVEAFVADELVGAAHGDDRGEFLLLLGAIRLEDWDDTRTVTVEVRVHAPMTAPAPESVENDPLADLPIEEVDAADGSLAPAAAGVVIPASHDATVTRELTLTVGRIRTDDALFGF